MKHAILYLLFFCLTIVPHFLSASFGDSGFDDMCLLDDVDDTESLSSSLGPMMNLSRRSPDIGPPLSPSILVQAHRQSSSSFSCDLSDTSSYGSSAPTFVASGRSGAFQTFAKKPPLKYKPAPTKRGRKSEASGPARCSVPSTDVLVDSALKVCSTDPNGIKHLQKMVLDLNRRIRDKELLIQGQETRVELWRMICLQYNEVLNGATTEAGRRLLVEKVTRELAVDTVKRAINGMLVNAHRDTEKLYAKIREYEAEIKKYKGHILEYHETMRLHQENALLMAQSIKKTEAEIIEVKQKIAVFESKSQTIDKFSAQIASLNSAIIDLKQRLGRFSTQLSDRTTQLEGRFARLAKRVSGLELHFGKIDADRLRFNSQSEDLLRRVAALETRFSGSPVHAVRVTSPPKPSQTGQHRQ